MLTDGGGARSAGEPPLGRGRVVQMVWTEFLDRPRRAPRELPVLALLSPHGSGKTEVLNNLAEKCRAHAAQPFAPVFDLAAQDTVKHGWQVVSWFAFQLNSRAWPQFGRLRFPRFGLGRTIVEGKVGTESPERTKQDIGALLREAGQLDRAAQGFADVTAQLPRLFGLPSWLGFFGRAGASALSSRVMLTLRFSTGMAFYGDALRERTHGGFPALVELNRLSREAGEASQGMIDRVLCEAFLADLAEAYQHGFRPRNCLVLVDNVDDDRGVGAAFLTALSDAKARRSDPHDPLVAVVASRRVAPLARLLDAAGVPMAPTKAWSRQDSEASYRDWLKARPAPSFQLYPVLLADLDQETVVEVARARSRTGLHLAGFVHSLTRGHPWGVRQVLATLDAVAGPAESAKPLTEEALRNVLDSPCPGHGAALGDLAVEKLVLADLRPGPMAALVACSAALDVIAAQEAGLAGRTALEAELVQRFWLEPGSDPGRRNAALHPWLRRLLLRELAAGGSGTAERPGAGATAWKEAYEALREKCADAPVPASYYELALGRFDGTVEWLDARFSQINESGEVSAERWIADFNTITSAPQEHLNYPSAVKRHQRLLGDLLGTAGPPEGRRATILTLVTARWIWSDPLGDPLLTLNPILENGFRDLALRCPWGQLRLIAEAEFYSRGGRP